MISFWVRDGWCDSKIQGIGEHCFGDYYAPLKFALYSNPWDSEMSFAYSPLNNFYFKVTNHLTELTNWPRMGLVFNLVLLVLCLIIPTLHLIKKKGNGSDIPASKLILLSLFSAPALILFDRGNTTFFIFLMLYFYFDSVFEKKYKKSTIFLTLAVLIKPQVLIVGVLILTTFGIVKGLRTLAITLTVFISSFALYPAEIFSSFSGWLSNSRQYQVYSPSPTLGNYSFSSFIGFLKGGVRKAFNPELDITGVFRPGLSLTTVSSISLVFACLGVAAMILGRAENSNFTKTLMSATLLELIPGTTFGYYLILMSLPALFLIGNKVGSPKPHEKLLKNLYFIYLIVSIPMWPIPWRLFGLDVGLAWETLSIQWLLSHVILSMIGIIFIVQTFFRTASRKRENH